MRQILIIFLFILVCQISEAQDHAAPRVILITLDGMRWQELFTGADSLLIFNSAYVRDTSELQQRFWRTTPEDRRKALFPFLWNEIVSKGQLHGNRFLGSKVNLTNQMWFSYPGYNEILTGKADDDRINSNDKIENPNVTFLEVAQHSEQYKDQVAAFGSWDVFPYIINEKRSGVPVNAGFELAKGARITAREEFLNQLQTQIPSPWNAVRLDAFTHHFALEYMRRKHPKIVYIAYGETDDFAHDGNYEAYLTAANNTDGFIRDLFAYTEEDPFYKGRTVFVITTDHGRGTVPPETWKSHGSEVAGAGQVWVVVFGPHVRPLGEIRTEEQLYSAQIAPVIYGVLGLKNPDKEASMPIDGLFTH